MMNRSRSLAGIAMATAAGFCLFVAAQPVDAQSAKPSKASIEHGKYMVETGGCGDCHTPKVLGPQGPVENPALALSGHQANTKVPEIPEGVLGPGKWMALASTDLTAWAGPWGVSFAANLTPDPGTGTGSWTEQMFLDAIRKGKHLGSGRPILPPMPWPAFSKMTDDDLKSIFAYSRLPIVNKVPEPFHRRNSGPRRYAPPTVRYPRPHWDRRVSSLSGKGTFVRGRRTPDRCGFGRSRARCAMPGPCGLSGVRYPLQRPSERESLTALARGVYHCPVIRFLVHHAGPRPSGCQIWVRAIR
jgi:mono/diheme cytochrome c family protein